MEHTFLFQITGQHLNYDIKNLFCEVRYIAFQDHVAVLDIKVPSSIYPLINKPIALTEDIQAAANNNAASMGLIPAKSVMVTVHEEIPLP